MEIGSNLANVIESIVCCCMFVGMMYLLTKD